MGPGIQTRSLSSQPELSLPYKVTCLHREARPVGQMAGRRGTQLHERSLLQGTSRLHRGRKLLHDVIHFSQ